MSTTAFLTSMLSYYPLLTAAFLCIFPMHHYLRHSLRRTFFLLALFLLPLIACAGFLEAYFSLAFNTLMPAILLICYLLYIRVIEVARCKSLAIFVHVCTLTAFIVNIAAGFDAWLHPTLDLNHFSFEACVFQAILATIVCILYFFPLWRYGCYLIDVFEIHDVWYTATAITAIFLFFNIRITPQHYETLYVNRMFLTYWTVVFVMLTLMLCLSIIFYQIVSGMLRSAEVRERNQILEMQENQFNKQQQYMIATERQRHDFKHTIRTLEHLAADGDIDAIRSFLSEYRTAMPENDILRFCENAAENAVLNYYYKQAEESGIETTFSINLPEDMKISDVDLCGILGNLLENAVLGCKTLPEAKRFIDLSVRTENAHTLYIVVTNSFDGKVRFNGHRYLSTRKNGNGIGLASVRSVAERYSGVARFSHEGNEFYSDVMLKI